LRYLLLIAAKNVIVVSEVSLGVQMVRTLAFNGKGTVEKGKEFLVYGCQQLAITRDLVRGTPTQQSLADVRQLSAGRVLE